MVRLPTAAAAPSLASNGKQPLASGGHLNPARHRGGPHAHHDDHLGQLELVSAGESFDSATAAAAALVGGDAAVAVPAPAAATPS